MEMWLRRLQLLFMVSNMAVSSPVVVLVNKTTNTEVIPEGSSVVLHCCIWTRIPQQFRIYWTFKPHRPTDNSSQYLSPILINVTPSTIEVTEACLKNKLSNQTLVTHDVSNFSHSHSGWYSCRYQGEIPIFSEDSSNWTELLVAHGSSLESAPFFLSDWWLWMTVAVVALMLMILLIVCAVLRTRQLRKRAREHPVYGNMQVISSRHPSPQHNGTFQNHQKTIEEEALYQNIQNPSPGQRYERGRRKHHY